MKRTASVTLVLVLLVASLGLLPALADETEILVNEQPTSGLIPGNSAGSFATYQIAYPGSETEITLTMSYGPFDPAATSAVGFTVYGPDSYEGQGTPDADGPYDVLNLSYSAEDAGTLTVQVYNYRPDAALVYTLSVSGLPQESELTQAVAQVASSETSAAETTTTETAAVGIPETTVVLVGQDGGAFDEYEIDYAGNEEDLTITVTYWPADPVTSAAFGFSLYGADGFEANGANTEDSGTAGAGILEVTYADEDSNHFLIQVYNYASASPVSYSISVTGASVTETAPTTSTADPAPVQSAAEETDVVEPATQQETLTLVGNPAGAFDYYELDYAGGEEDLTITITYWPADPVTSAAFGFNVYGTDYVAYGAPTEDSGVEGAGILAVTYSAEDAAHLLVQVYNYAEGTPVTYQYEVSN